MKEAMLYETGEDNRVHCHLCSHRCKIREGKRGICGVRENQAGTLYSLVYGTIVAENIDPIEKKPLFNFLPGSRSYSIGTVGCNFHCMHCQNYEISQYPHARGSRIIGAQRTPEAIVQAARDADCASIAYTYTEPTIFFEFAHDTGRLAHQKGIKNVFVSNGYMSTEALDRIAPCLDAINVDLKAFTDKFYKEVCGARRAPVLETIQNVKDRGIWVEVTTLVIPGLNDSADELRDIARFVKSVGCEVPWHVTAFYPTYKMTDRPPTPAATLRRARDIGLAEGLRYVYEGNVPAADGEHTYCPGCGEVVIMRSGFGFIRNQLKGGKCPHCGVVVDGVGV